MTLETCAIEGAAVQNLHRENGIKTLNVAGSRELKEPGVAAFVKLALEDAFFPRAEAMVLRG